MNIDDRGGRSFAQKLQPVNFPNLQLLVFPRSCEVFSRIVNYGASNRARLESILSINGGVEDIPSPAFLIGMVQGLGYCYTQRVDHLYVGSGYHSCEWGSER